MAINDCEPSRTIGAVRQRYIKIIAQCFSNDGNQVAAIDAYGRFIAFSCPYTASSFDAVFWNIPFVKPSCVNSADSYFACGDRSGRLRLFNWSALANAANFLHLSVSTPPPTVCLKIADTALNAVLTFPKNNNEQNVVVGCGDGSIYLSDIEMKKVLISFDGHKEQVNRLALRCQKTGSDDNSSNFEFASCSNDGIVHLWDVRVGKKPVKTLRVYQSEQVRTNFTRGIFALDIDDDFVVCGGGVSLGMWHLSSESLVANLNVSNGAKTNSSSCDNYQYSESIIYTVVEMSGGQILAGGRGPLNGKSYLQKFNYTGTHVLSVPLRGIQAIYAISSSSRLPSSMKDAAHRKGGRITLVSGESPKIFCLNDAGFILHTVDVGEAHQLNPEMKQYVPLNTVLAC